jgi:hypothetical protein
VTGLDTVVAVVAVGALLYGMQAVFGDAAARLATRPRPDRTRQVTNTPFDAFRDTGRLLAAWAPTPTRLPLSRHAVVGLVLGLLGLGFIGIVFAVFGWFEVKLAKAARGRVVAAAALTVNILVNFAWFVVGLLLATGWAR